MKRNCAGNNQLIDSYHCRFETFPRDANILASSRPLPFDFRLPTQKLEQLFRQSKGHILEEIDNKRVCIAHALSPGFETYATGWRAILIQDID